MVDARRCNCRIRPGFGPWKSAAPATALDSAQDSFDLCIEGRRLFQIDRVAGIGTDPQARVGKSGFEHQVGLEAADILVTYGEKNQHHHP